MAQTSHVILCGHGVLKTTVSFLLESQTHRYVALDQAGFLHPLGLRHFYDGFSLRAGISIRAAALVAFGFQEHELSSDLILSQAAVVARGWADHQEQPVDQNAPEADRRNVPEPAAAQRAVMMRVTLRNRRCRKSVCNTP